MNVDANDLKYLRALAGKLRQLACVMLSRRDRSLYLQVQRHWKSTAPTRRPRRRRLTPRSTNL